jgi:DNA-binding response OmpR family regulator
MKTLSILTQENPSRQWCAWINALTETDLIIRDINTAPVDYDELIALQSDAILLDGMLPHLTQIITLLHALHSQTRILVATDADSFTVLYEMRSLGESDYLAGPMDAAEFAKDICRKIPGATDRAHDICAVT